MSDRGWDRDRGDRRTALGPDPDRDRVGFGRSGPDPGRGQGGLMGGGYAGGDDWAREQRRPDRDRSGDREGRGVPPPDRGDFGSPDRGFEGRGPAADWDDPRDRLQPYREEDDPSDRRLQPYGEDRDHPRGYERGYEHETYRNWRDRQMEQHDRDYHDFLAYQRERFAQDFEAWRRERDRSRSTGSSAEGQSGSAVGPVGWAGQASAAEGQPPGSAGGGISQNELGGSSQMQDQASGGQPGNQGGSGQSKDQGSGGQSGARESQRQGGQSQSGGSTGDARPADDSAREQIPSRTDDL